MCDAVPDCLTIWFESLLSGLKLPDPDDRHILAAAILVGSDVIVAENIKDFPTRALGLYNIEAQTSDVFLLYLIDLAPTTVRSVIEARAAALKKPPMTVEEVLDGLARSGLPRSVAELRSL